MASRLPVIEQALLEMNQDLIGEEEKTEYCGLALSILSGKFEDVLRSQPALNIWKPTQSLDLDGFEVRMNTVYDSVESALDGLCVGIACLQAFVQENFTGPSSNISANAILKLSPHQTEEALNAYSISKLAYGGECVYHLTLQATLLLLSITIFKSLQESSHKPLSVHWWLQRAVSIQQRILSDSTHIEITMPTYLESVSNKLRARWYSEVAIKALYEGNDRSAKSYLDSAAESSGLKWELSGAMGKRTKYQVDEIAQLVLIAESSSLEESSKLSLISISNLIIDPALEADQAKAVPNKLALNDDTLLESAVFNEGSKAGHRSPLNALDHTILLGFCLNIQAINPVHSLTDNEMQAYVERVLDDPHNWSIGTMALFMRCRLEAQRSRTVERSVLQTQALIDQMPSAECSVIERLRFFYSLGLPSKWSLQKELGLRYKSIGAVKSALDIFETLEMWEDVIDCWTVLERPDKGKKIVMDLLEGRLVESQQSMRIASLKPNEVLVSRLDYTRESRFWCILGDLEPQNAVEHYKKAWNVSKHTSSRAMRSLGGLYYSRGNFKEASDCLQVALKINPLFIRSWFVLGCSAVRLNDWDIAIEAFNRCVSLDEDDSESWNNLASVYLQVGEMEAANQKKLEIENKDGTEVITTKEMANISYDRKDSAFKALKYGVKAGYDNWKIWANYMIVAVDVGELGEACRAFARVLQIQSPKIGEAAIDVSVLERLISAVLKTPLEEINSKDGSYNYEAQLLKQVDSLFEKSILPILVSLPQVHLLQARLYFWRKQWKNCLECHLKAYRCSVASNTKLEVDSAEFDAACTTVQELVEMLTNLGEKDVIDENGQHQLAMPDWKFQCKSILRTFLGRTRDSFEETASWQSCNDLLEDLKPKKA